MQGLRKGVEGFGGVQVKATIVPERILCKMQLAYACNPSFGSNKNARLHAGCLAYKHRLSAVGLTKVEEVGNGTSSRKPCRNTYTLPFGLERTRAALDPPNASQASSTDPNISDS